MTLTWEQSNEIRTAWNQVQVAHDAMMHASTDFWDAAVHAFNGAQARYDALIAEYAGVTTQERLRMLEEARACGVLTDFFAPTG